MPLYIHKTVSSVLNFTFPEFHYFFSSNYGELNVSNIKLLSGFLHKVFLYISVINLIHVFLLHRHFPVFCSWIFFLWNVPFNVTHYDKSCQLYWTTSSMTVCRSELWTVSKSITPEISYLMYFIRILHFHECNSNWK